MQLFKLLKKYALPLAAIAVLLSACGSANNYEDLLNAEKEIIGEYIDRNNIKVIDHYPADSVWTEGGRDIYYQTENGIYIHIVEKGDGTTAVKSSQEVLARYRKITLTLPPDTVIRNWYTDISTYPEPEKFYYQSGAASVAAFQEAVGIMKYHDSRAKIIVPSKQGSSEDKDNVMPYFYDFTFRLGN